MSTAYGIINNRKFDDMLKFYRRIISQLTYLNTHGHLPSVINSIPTSVIVIPTVTSEVSTKKIENFSEPDNTKGQADDLTSNPKKKGKYLELDERRSNDSTTSVRRTQWSRSNELKNRVVSITKM